MSFLNEKQNEFGHCDRIMYEPGKCILDIGHCSGKQCDEDIHCHFDVPDPLVRDVPGGAFNHCHNRDRAQKEKSTGPLVFQYKI